MGFGETPDVDQTANCKVVTPQVPVESVRAVNETGLHSVRQNNSVETRSCALLSFNEFNSSESERSHVSGVTLHITYDDGGETVYTPTQV